MTVAGSRVAIFSLTNDLHAFTIADSLERLHGVKCSVVLTDRLAGTGGLSWTNSHPPVTTLRDAAGDAVSVDHLEVIWWRRSPRADLLRIPPEVTDEAARDLIANDIRATLVGSLLTEFSGAWISHPESTRRAENKLVQLKVAREAGFTVPETLVSQDPLAIRDFVARRGSVVVKPVAGTIRTPLQAGLVEPEMLARDGPLALCPAIYQHFVPGDRHLRVCCFGTQCYTAAIESPQMDWRLGPMEGEEVTISDDLAWRLQQVLRVLDLRMGIFDLKVDQHGEAVWLEVNPQGQFLFMEGLCGLPLITAFTDFIMSELEGDQVGLALSDGEYGEPPRAGRGPGDVGDRGVAR